MRLWLNHTIQWLISGRKPWPADEFFGHTIHDREWRLIPEIIRRHGLVSLYCFVVLIALVWAAKAGNSDVFSRLGAFVVAGAVFLEFTAGKRFRLDAEKKRLEKFIQELDHRNDKIIEEYLYQYVKCGNKDTWVKKPNTTDLLERYRQIESKESAIIMLEVSIVVVGTLIWAFGDWFICSLHSWSLSTCSS